MSEIAYVFPGQGAQRVGMGLDLYNESPAARSTFQQADEALGFSLSRLCFEGPADTLKQTVNAQPAVFVVSLACLAAAKDSLGDDFPAPYRVAGHSLGEYTALVAGGALNLTEGVRLVRERGRLMQQAGEKQPGGMTAVLGADFDVLEAVCRETGVEIANINCPGQTVISGTKQELDQAAQLGLARGCKRFMPLEVSGAFHSRWMVPAYQGLARAVESCRIGPLEVPLVTNVTAREISVPAEVRQELLAQLSGCVRWQDSVEHMLSCGVSTFVEMGPGQVLAGLVKRTSKEARTLNIGSAADVKNWKL